MINLNGPWTTFQPSTKVIEYNKTIFYITSWCYFQNKKDAISLFSSCEEFYPSSQIQLGYNKNNPGVFKYSIEIISKIRITDKEHERQNMLGFPISETGKQRDIFEKMCKNINK
jgi:hypothetical protein